MAESAESVRLELRLDRGGLDDESVDRLMRSLRRAIDEAELASVRVERPTGEAPAGSRGDAFTLGALALAVAPVLIEQVLQLLREWSARPGAAPVKISVPVGDREISGEYDSSRMTAEEVRRIAEMLRAALK